MYLRTGPLIENGEECSDRVPALLIRHSGQLGQAVVLTNGDDRREVIWLLIGREHPLMIDVPEGLRD